MHSFVHLCGKEIDEGTDAGCEMFVAGENRVDFLRFMRIVILQHFHQPAAVDVRFDIEFADAGNAEPCQAQIAGDRAAGGLDVAGRGARVARAGGRIAKQPFAGIAAEGEGDAIMCGQIFRALWQPAAREIVPAWRP
jgi:hypothetical protein